VHDLIASPVRTSYSDSHASALRQC